MMSKAVLFILSVCIVQYASAQDIGLPEIKNLNSFKLKGPVKSITERAYTVNPASLPATDTGKITLPPGSYIFKSQTELLFNEDGMLQKERTGTVPENKDEIKDYTTTFYHFDEEGNLSGKANYENDRIQDSVYYQYNRKGEIGSRFSYDRKGRKLKRYQYTYDYTTRMPKTIRERDETNMLLSMIKLEYDAKGRLTERQIQGTDLKMRKREVTTYKPLGDTAEQVNHYMYGYGDLEPESMYSAVMDLNGNYLEKTVIDTNRRVVSQSTYSYDSLGNQTEEITFTMVKYHTTSEYKYDQYGNWTERKMYKDGLPYMMVNRGITYFDAPETAAQ